MSLIKIKRSGSSGEPGSLSAGELAYSFLSGDLSNGGDRLYFGTGSGVNVIGGKYFTDKLDHTPGTLTASSAILVDADSKVNNIKVGNLDLASNTLSSTDSNGAVVIDPAGNGKVEFAFVNNTASFAQVTGPTAEEYVTNITGAGKENAIPNRQYVDNAAAAAAAGSILTIDADTGTDIDVNLADDDLQLVANANGLSTSVAKDGTNVTVTFALAQDIQTTASPEFVNTTLTGDLAVNGGDITTTETTFNLVNTTATTVNFAGAATSLTIGANNGTVTFGNDVTITGDLIVSGDTVTVDVTTLDVEDPLIRLAKGNTTDAVDIGFVGSYGASGTTGLFRDATNGVYRLFATGSVSNNVVTVDTLAELDAIIDGGTY